MGLMEIASGKSIWRGYHYYEAGLVLDWEQCGPHDYKGTVQGSEDNKYEVVLDLEHAKRSTCSCPHAEGTRRACKHKLALYFAIFPEEAEKLKRAAEEYEAQIEERQRAIYEEVKKYVYSLKKDELRDELLWRMIEERERMEWW